MALATAPTEYGAPDRVRERDGGRGRPPSESLVIDRVRRLQAYAADRDLVDRGQQDLLDCNHPIDLPPDVLRRDPPITHAAMLQRQVGLTLGILSNQRPSIKVAALGRGEGRQQEAQGLAGFANRYGPLCELQGGRPVHVPVTQDQLVFGRGVTAVEPFTAAYGAAPRRADYPTADAYKAADERWTRSQGTAAGRLPIVVRRVDPRQFYWLESPEEGGLYLTAERRVRTLRDLLDDPRYADALAGTDWASRHDARRDRDARAADQDRVGLWIVQDKHWCAYLLDPLPAGDGEDDADGPYTPAGLGATLLRTHPNRLGRPNYVVTKGLPSNSQDGARDTVGIGYAARWLMREICQILTLRGLRMRDNAFPAWLAIRGPTRSNGTEVLPDPLPPEQQRIELARGNGMVTILDNVTLQQVLSRGSDDEVPYSQALEKKANDLMLPDAILEGGTSGYEYNSLRNTIESRLNPVLHGQERAAIGELRLIYDWAALMGERFAVTAIEQGGAVTYALDPRDTPFEDYVIEATLELERPEDMAAKIQQVRMAVEGGVLSMKTARSTIMHMEASAEEDFQTAVERYAASPEVQQAIQQRAAAQAGILLDKEQALAEGPPDLATLLKLSEPLLKALAMTVQPGMAGYDSILKAMQQAGLQPPPIAAPPPNGGPPTGPPSPAGGPPPPIGGPGGPPPPGSPPLPLPGGRAPGQLVEPGGPHLTGGFS